MSYPLNQESLRAAGWSDGAYFFAYVLAFAALQAGLLSALRTGASVDGAEQLLYTQSFELGYGRSQPPLYTWLLLASHSLFGVTLLAEAVLKFGLLAGALIAFRALLVELGISRAASAGAALLFLVPEILWETQRNYTHSVILLAATPAVLLCYLRLRRSPSSTGFAVLGVLFAALLLAKYNSALFIAALVAADLVVKRRAAVARDCRFAIALIVAGLLFAPHGLWMLDNWAAVTALSDKFHAGAGESPLLDRAEGLARYLLALASLLGPPALLVLIAGRARIDRATLREPALALPLAAATILFVFGLVLIVGFGVSDVSTRWVLPFVFVCLPVLALAMERQSSAVAIRRLERLGAIVALAALIALSWNAVAVDRRMHYDYRALAEELGAAGFDSVVSQNYPVFANLRLVAPAIRLADPALPRPDLFLGRRPAAIWVNGGDSRSKAAQAAADFGLAFCAGGERAATLPTLWRGEPLAIGYAPLSRGACPLTRERPDEIVGPAALP